MIKKYITGVVLATVFATSAIATEVSSYLYADYKDNATVVSTLESYDFEIVGEYDTMGDDNYHVIVFTNTKLKEDASKESRGFAGVIKVLVSTVDKQLVFTNPHYFLRAFMQADYNEKTADSIKNQLTSAFGTFEGSKESLDDDDISGYHYMFAMPYYEDMIEIAEGENLVESIRKNAGNKLVFELKLKSSTLMGIEMDGDKGEKAYISLIKGQKHSAFEPYMILVEDNKAKILHAKYYLALAYPNLTMGQFMDISDTPDDIEAFMTQLTKK